MSKFSGRLVLFGGPVLILGAFILLFAVLFSTAPEPERGEVEARPVAEFVTEAEARPVQLTVNTQGEVRPLCFRVAGEDCFFEGDDLLDLRVCIILAIFFEASLEGPLWRLHVVDGPADRSKWSIGGGKPAAGPPGL